MKNTTNKDLNKLLDEAQELPLEGGKRTGLIDWPKVKSKLTGAGYFKIADVQADLAKDLAKRGVVGEDGKPKEVYYSQVMDQIKRWAKNDTGIKVSKKGVDAGEYKGKYYRIDEVEAEEPAVEQPPL